MSAIGPVPGVGALDGVVSPAPAPTATDAAPSGKSFGDVLGDKLGELQQLQDDASAQAQALATGQADDIAGVTMAVERASIALQLAAEVRDKAVAAYSQIFQMQV